MRKEHIISPGTRVRLSEIDPGQTPLASSETESIGELARLKERLQDLQAKLFAWNGKALLILFQGMDTAGKDGVIRSITGGLDLTGCQVTSFKSPSVAELDHDFLWRVHQAVPPRGTIGIHNRSHYEDVLVVRVHDMVPKAVWKARYDQINAFEKLLHDNDVAILKFFLHISKEEQERRLLARLLNPKKNWKFAREDILERKYWDAYQEAYEDLLQRCSTPTAPWFVIPADNKWYRNLAVTSILVDMLEDLGMSWPLPTAEVKELARQARLTGQLPVLK